MGFWVGFWVGLRARNFPTERVLSWTPLIIRTVDQKKAARALRALFSASSKVVSGFSPPTSKARAPGSPSGSFFFF